MFNAAAPVDKKEQGEPKFEKMHIDDYYRFKSDHLDETDSQMDQEIYK